MKLLHRLGYPFSRTSITNSSSAALSRVERSNESSRTTRGLQILHRDIERGSGMTERKNNITFWLARINKVISFFIVDFRERIYLFTELIKNAKVVKSYISYTTLFSNINNQLSVCSL